MTGRTDRRTDFVRVRAFKCGGNIPLLPRPVTNAWSGRDVRTQRTLSFPRRTETRIGGGPSERSNHRAEGGTGAEEMGGNCGH